MLHGRLDVGFVTTGGRMVAKTTEKGDVFVFPRGCSGGSQMKITEGHYTYHRMYLRSLDLNCGIYIYEYMSYNKVKIKLYPVSGTPLKLKLDPPMGCSTSRATAASSPPRWLLHSTASCRARKPRPTRCSTQSWPCRTAFQVGARQVRMMRARLAIET